MNTVSVRFDGKVVAVPGRENNVEFFNLETFKEIEERKNLQCSDLEHGNKENFSVVSFFTKREVLLRRLKRQKVHRLER